MNGLFQEEKMNKGFTLIETLVSLALLMLAVLFSARITVFALDQSRHSSLRFRLIETCDYYKNYLSSLPFSSPDLVEGSHQQVGQKFTVTWRVELAEAELKRINLLVAGPNYSLPLAFYKSHFIQEVKND
jgi:prepilin-type N-terminal cleavage/methylation domain-containing protein